MIQKLFDYDGPFMRFITLLSRLSVISLLWLLLCLPIVTAGAATAGLCAAANDLREGGTKVVPVFFSAFRRCFVPATLQWVLTLLPLVALAAGFYALKENGIELPFPAICLIGTALLVLFFICLWFYPILCFFRGSFAELFLNAMILAFVHIPFTILAAVLFAGALFLTQKLGQAGLFLILFGPGLLAYAILNVFSKPLSVYTDNTPDKG